MWIARHAESTWNAEGRWQGQADPPLSRRGQHQAKALAEHLTARGVHRLVASDLERAAQTARVAGLRLGVAPRLEPRLRERDVGTWSGCTHAEIARRFSDELARLRAGDPELRPGGGESFRELEARVRAVFAEIAAWPDAEEIAVITHLGVIRVLEPHVQVEPAAFWTPGGSGAVSSGEALL
ncbi:MAG TPA: histidine phosphatase family protein [Myxococcota bacterium]|nr:histidine phosphatase family protein [Myxococcota bacterium]